MPRGKERPQPDPSVGYRRNQPSGSSVPSLGRPSRNFLLYLGGAALALLLLFGWTRGLGALIPSTCLFHPSAP
jgi:hypothetical protein